MEESFGRNDLIWGKLKSYPWWPAIVLNPADCGVSKVADKKMWVFWFGDHSRSQIDFGNMKDFKMHYSANTHNRSTNMFSKALLEILNVCADRDGVPFSESSSMLEWARTGFGPSKLSKPYQASSNLPDIVLKCLKKTVLEPTIQKKKLSRPKNQEKLEKIYSNPVVAEIHEGSKSVEEICIGCCEKNCRIIIGHPLFLGGTCQNCKKHIVKTCQLRIGKKQEKCIICGKGRKSVENLVYCYNSICLRAYCRSCIENLTPDGSYLKIVENSEWLCYLCKSDPIGYIKHRKVNEPTDVEVTCSRELKPIRVLSCNDIALPILKEMNIIVEDFSVEPPDGSQFRQEKNDFFPEFSTEEIVKMNPSFVYGSYITQDTPQQNEKTESKQSNSSVWFLFVVLGKIIDDMIVHRIFQFLEIYPVCVSVNNQSYLLWSNFVSNSCTLKFRNRGSVFSDEEIILYEVLSELKPHFQSTV